MFITKKLAPETDLGGSDSDVSGGAVTPQNTENNENTGSENTGESVEEKEPANLEEKPVQTPEQNRAFKEMRLKAEAAEKKAKSADAWVEKNFGQSHNLHTWEDYQTAIAKEEEQKQRQQLEQAGIDPNLINQIIDNNPTVQQAKAVIEKSKNDETNKKLDSELQDLIKEFPDCGMKTMIDFVNHPKFDEMLPLIQRGYELSDAYEKINRAEIRKKAAEAARQSTLNNVNSKEHLQTPGESGSVDITSVPEDTLKIFKQWFPSWTNEQIAKYYKDNK